MNCLLCDNPLPLKLGYKGGRSKQYCDGVCRQKNYRNKHLYSLKNEAYREMMERVDCEICHRKLRLVVDHDHKTKLSRGSLCHECNKALGAFHDDIELLKSALVYLCKSGGYDEKL